jgi:hypothetical protein
MKRMFTILLMIAMLKRMSFVVGCNQNEDLVVETQTPTPTQEVEQETPSQQETTPPQEVEQETPNVDEEDEVDEVDEVSIPPTRGNFDGSVYTSEWLGMRIEIPGLEEWWENDIAPNYWVAIMEDMDPTCTKDWCNPKLVIEANFGEEIPEEFWDEREEAHEVWKPLWTFSAQKHNRPNNISDYIEIQYRRLTLEQINFTEIDYINHIISSIENGDVFNLISYEIFDNPIRIGNYDWIRYERHQEEIRWGVETWNIIYININDRFVRTISISAFNSNENLHENHNDFLNSWITPYP